MVKERQESRVAMYVLALLSKTVSLQYNSHSLAETKQACLQDTEKSQSPRLVVDNNNKLWAVKKNFRMVPHVGVVSGTKHSLMMTKTDHRPSFNSSQYGSHLRIKRLIIILEKSNNSNQILSSSIWAIYQLWMQCRQPKPSFSTVKICLERKRRYPNYKHLIIISSTQKQ